LAAHTLSLLADPETRRKDALELFGVSRICERRGEAARARKFYSQSIAAELPEETGRAARKSLARLAKRDGDFLLACELWTAMLGNSREGLEAYEQLAIHYERRSREFDRATVLVRAALAELRRAHRLGAVAADVHRRYRTRFEARLARLERKVGRTLLDAAETMEAESKSPVGESN
jgi:tetratricopeptide (TPR) repeat protein